MVVLSRTGVLACSLVAVALMALTNLHTMPLASRHRSGETGQGAGWDTTTATPWSLRWTMWIPQWGEGTGGVRWFDLESGNDGKPYLALSGPMLLAAICALLVGTMLRWRGRDAVGRGLQTASGPLGLGCAGLFWFGLEAGIRDVEDIPLAFGFWVLVVASAGAVALAFLEMPEPAPVEA